MRMVAALPPSFGDTASRLLFNVRAEIKITPKWVRGVVVLIGNHHQHHYQSTIQLETQESSQSLPRWISQLQQSSGDGFFATIACDELLPSPEDTDKFCVHRGGGHVQANPNSPHITLVQESPQATYEAWLLLANRLLYGVNLHHQVLVKTISRVHRTTSLKYQAYGQSMRSVKVYSKKVTFTIYHG